MEVLFGIIIIVALFWFIGFLWSLPEKRRKRIRNEVAEEVLNEDKGILQKIEFYKKKLEELGYKRKDPSKEEVISDYKYWTRQSHKKIFDECPECNDGFLLTKTGTYGKFIGCSRFPRCKFTISKKKYSEDIRREFIKDLNKAYS